MFSRLPRSGLFVLVALALLGQAGSGLAEELSPGTRIDVRESESFPSPTVFRDATEKYAKQVVLADDFNRRDNYVAWPGQSVAARLDVRKWREVAECARLLSTRSRVSSPKLAERISRIGVCDVGCGF